MDWISWIILTYLITTDGIFRKKNSLQNRTCFCNHMFNDYKEHWHTTFISRLAYGLNTPFALIYSVLCFDYSKNTSNYTTVQRILFLTLTFLCAHEKKESSCVFDNFSKPINGSPVIWFVRSETSQCFPNLRPVHLNAGQQRSRSVITKRFDSEFSGKHENSINTV